MPKIFETREIDVQGLIAAIPKLVLNHEEEKIVEVRGFEGLYAISNFGRAFSLHDRHGTIPSARQLRGMNSRGYRAICAHNKTSKATILPFHRTVAKHFIRPVRGKMFVNHIDGNKLNNHYRNLEWCTIQENIQHAKDNGLNRAPKGEHSGRAKLTDRAVLQIIDEYNNGATRTELSKEYRISHHHVCLIIKKQTWKHLFVNQ